ncbi:hypothetical protein GCM10028808_73990 [Spirosoma migulaei]
MQSDVINPSDIWNWQPKNPNVKHIYASGHKTATKSSTYAAERDNESDFDRPNEGA